MRLTTRSSYGVRAMAFLAVRYEDGMPVSIKKISAAEDISSVYLEQIFFALKNKGLVRSVRGPGGGYFLSRSPQKISVYEIVDVLDGDTVPSACSSPAGKRASSCDKASGACVSKRVWDRLAASIRETLMSLSLGDILIPDTIDGNRPSKEDGQYEKSLSGR